MVLRSLKPSFSSSFILFGPRGCGKTTLLRKHFEGGQTLTIDLLSPETEAEYLMHPSLLLERWKAENPRPEWVVVDEVQKVPAILDVVHQGIEQYGIRFALTGSSARKLMRGASNLLAGRAFIYHLHPFTADELGDSFDLTRALRWGTLPGVQGFADDADRKRFLRAYALTYLREEIQLEQLVRKMEPFRRFLEVAAQASGEVINNAALGREAGVDSKTVLRYYEVLKETWVAYFLEPWHRSVRKQQTQHPKIFLFDTGVTRALQNQLDVQVTASSYAWGRLFEQFVISECLRRSAYLERDWRFHYLRTKDGAEIDLVVDRPGKPPALIEIKSSQRVDQTALRSLKDFAADFPHSPRWVFSCEKTAREVDGIRIVPWLQGVAELFADG